MCGAVWSGVVTWWGQDLAERHSVLDAEPSRSPLDESRGDRSHSAAAATLQERSHSTWGVDPHAATSHPTLLPLSPPLLSPPLPPPLPGALHFEAKQFTSCRVGPKCPCSSICCRSASRAAALPPRLRGRCNASTRFVLTACTSTAFAPTGSRYEGGSSRPTPSGGKQCTREAAIVASLGGGRALAAGRTKVVFPGPVGGWVARG